MLTVKQVMRTLPLLLLASALAFAGGASSWESHSFFDFVRGRFTGISLTRDGRLTLAPRLDSVFSSGETGVWSIASAPDGTLYLGTGHRGRLYRITPNGQASSIWTAPQPEIFALAVDARGAVYAGTSPDGRVWKIDGAQVTEFYNPQSKYIWALAFAPDGSLFVATGDNGRIHRVSPSGQGEVWYETGQSHVTSLAVDARGRLIAGTEPNGIIYRVEAKDRAFVLFDSPLPEIRSLIPMPDGSVYAAALGGSVTQRQAQSATDASSTHNIPVVTTSITVTADAAAQQGGLDVKPKPDAAKPQTPAFTEATPPTSPVIDMSGVEKSAIYRIEPDNMVETIWSSKEENVFDLTVNGSDITFSTDQQGRIYRLTPELKSVLLVETREGETTRLLQQSAGLLAATSNLGKLYLLSQGLAPSGTYESPVHDAGNVARWGRLDFRSQPGSGSIVFRTRSGNSERPDKTWSNWSAPITASAGAPLTSPNARYIQFQVEMRSGGAVPPVLDSVTLTYQPRNARPTVRSIAAYPQWIGDPSKAAQPQPAGAAYSITVTDTGAASAAATSAGTPTQTLTRSGRPQIYLSWIADDPDGDALVYAVHYRAEDERDWKLLKDNLTEAALSQDAEVFADGRYLFRVTASDKPANSEQAARESDLISQPVLIDLTPPSVTLSARRDGAVSIVTATAADAASPLRRAEYSVNAAPWRAVESTDGITDSRSETYEIRLTPPPGQETTVVVRVLDSAGNPGLAKVVLN